MKCRFDEQQFVDDARGLLRIKSENRDSDVDTASPLGRGVHAAIRYMLDLGTQYGFTVKDVDGFCGYIEMGDAPDMIGILTHVDTVPTGEGWDMEPFDGTVRDGRLYGRGTCDDKGPTVLALHAMKALRDSGAVLNKRVRLILGGDEESGLWTCMERYKQTEEIPTCSFSPDGAYPATFAEKGILRLRIHRTFDSSISPLRLSAGMRSNIVPEYARAELDGTVIEAHGKPGHSMAPHLGENALCKLCDTLRTQGVHHPFVALVGMATVKGFDIALSDAPSGALTINPSLATVDETAGELTCDIRYSVTLDEADIIARISRTVAPLGFTVEKISGNAPLYVPTSHPLIIKLQQAYQEVTGDPAPPAATGGGTYARAFPNAVAFGVLFPTTENTCHKANEYWSLDDIRTNFNIMIRTLQLLQQD